MVFTAFADQLFQPRMVAGVEIAILQDKSWICQMCVLKKEKTTIQIEKQLQDITDIAELKKNIPVDVPLVLVLNGRNILHRKIETVGKNDSEEVLLRKIIPNGQITDFYLQKHPVSSGFFISLIRRDFLDELLKPFFEQFNWILSVKLGVFVVETLLPFLLPNNSLVFENHQLILNERKIEDYTTLSTPFNTIFKVGDESIDSIVFPAYAAALAALTGNYQAYSLNLKQIDFYQKEWRAFRLFSVLVWIVLLFFFIGLLTNFFIFSNLTKKNEALTLQGSFYNRQLIELDSLEKEINTRQGFFQQIGWIDKSKHSYYADQLAATIPSEIRLTELSLNPLDEKKSKNEKKLIFLYNKVLIEGKCKDAAIFNRWVKEVEKLSWVEATTEQNYQFDNTKGTGVFGLFIILKDN